MDFKAVCVKVSNNQLTYDEALRVSSYIEKVSNLLNLRINFNIEDFLNKSLELTFTTDDAGNLEKVLSYITQQHEQYQNKIDTKNSQLSELEYSTEEYRPRKKKFKHR